MIMMTRVRMIKGKDGKDEHDEREAHCENEKMSNHENQSLPRPSAPAS